VRGRERGGSGGRKQRRRGGGGGGGGGAGKGARRWRGADAHAAQRRRGARHAARGQEGGAPHLRRHKEGPTTLRPAGLAARALHSPRASPSRLHSRHARAERARAVRAARGPSLRRPASHLAPKACFLRAPRALRGAARRRRRLRGWQRCGQAGARRRLHMDGACGARSLASQDCSQTAGRRRALRPPGRLPRRPSRASIASHARCAASRAAPAPRGPRLPRPVSGSRAPNKHVRWRRSSPPRRT